MKSGADNNPGPRIQTRRFASRAELNAALVDRLIRALTEANRSGPPRAVMLSGGSTPIPVYRVVATRKPRAAGTVVVMFTDERYVPQDNEASNYFQSRPLLDALALPKERVLRVRTELSLQEAAEDYERRIFTLLNSGGTIGLGLLGLGADGHTASLFDLATLEKARDRHVIAVRRPDGRDAVSVTPLLLTKVEEPLFIVAGEDKRTALREFLNRNPESIAWRAVNGCKRVEVWTEPAALPAD